MRITGLVIGAVAALAGRAGAGPAGQEGGGRLWLRPADAAAAAGDDQAATLVLTVRAPPRVRPGETFDVRLPCDHSGTIALPAGVPAGAEMDVPLAQFGEAHDCALDMAREHPGYFNDWVAYDLAERAKRLARDGDDVDLADDDGMTPLHFACLNGDVAAARLLLDRGANADRAMPDGATALHLASYNGHVDAARLLLDRGADADRADQTGATALSVARRNGHHDVARLLLDRGAATAASRVPRLLVGVAATLAAGVLSVWLLFKRNGAADGAASLEAEAEPAHASAPRRRQPPAEPGPHPGEAPVEPAPRETKSARRRKNRARGRPQPRPAAEALGPADVAVALPSAPDEAAGQPPADAEDPTPDGRGAARGAGHEPPPDAPPSPAAPGSLQPAEAGRGATEAAPMPPGAAAAESKTEEHPTSLGAAEEVPTPVAAAAAPPTPVAAAEAPPTPLAAAAPPPTPLAAAESKAEERPTPREAEEHPTPPGAPAAESKVEEDPIQLGAAEEKKDDWTPPDACDPVVVSLLGELGLKSLAPLFAEADVDAEALGLLTADDLATVGVDVGAARRIVAAVADQRSADKKLAVEEELTGAAVHQGRLEEALRLHRGHLKRMREVLTQGPDAFVCPISCEVMLDPVLAADGFTYERICIEQWLERANTSPKTNEILGHKNLTPNRMMKILIRDLLEERGALQDALGAGT